MKQGVVIVGRNRDHIDPLMIKSGMWEFWGLNTLYLNLKDVSWTRWFEIHDIRRDDNGKWLRKGKSEFRGLSIEEYLRGIDKLKVLTYMKDINPIVSMSVQYPKDRIVETFGNYFTSTFSWMLALAINMKYKHIRVVGVNMHKGSEYYEQKPSIEYLIGFGRGLGVNIQVSMKSGLMKCDPMYGF